MNHSRFIDLKNKILPFFNKTFFLSLIGLPIIHFFVVKFALTLSLENGVLAVWPSSGIYAAGVLSLGFRFLPAIALSELIVNTWLYSSNNSWLATIIISICNWLDFFLIYVLTCKFIGDRNFLERAQDIFKFVAIVMGESFFTSNVAIAVLHYVKIIPSEAYWISWWTWWIGVIIPILFITPPILVWTKRSKETQPLPKSWKTELLLMVFLIAVITQLSFAKGYAIEYTLLPILVWSSFRFRHQETTLITLLISVLAIWGTIKGIGSFHRASTTESLIILQSFIGVFALTALVLSAAMRENWWAEFRLKQANETLEERVRERTVELQETLQQLTLTQSHIIQSEKMSSLGQLVAGVAHEINNPVNFIHGNISHLRIYIKDLISLINLYQKNNDITDPKIQELTEEIDLDFLLEDLPKMIASMQIGTERIRDIVLSLRNFSRMDESEIKLVDLHEGIDNTLLILQHRLKSQPEHPTIEVIRDYHELPKIECYAGSLNQVFMNILVNAIDAIEENNADLTLETRQQKQDKIIIRTQVIDAQWVEIVIADRGKGMPESVRNRIFDPFFTTKAIGKGTGMGMAISYQIITEKHRGILNCLSIPGEGTEFMIKIPIKQST